MRIQLFRWECIILRNKSDEKEMLNNDAFGASAGLFGSVVLELVHLLGAPTGRHLHCVGALCWAIQTNGNVLFMDVLYLSLVYVFGGHIVGLDATNGVQHSTL